MDLRERILKLIENAEELIGEKEELGGGEYAKAKAEGIELMVFALKAVLNV